MACTSQVYDSLDTCEGEHATQAILEESLHSWKDNCKKPVIFFLLLVKKKETKQNNYYLYNIWIVFSYSLTPVQCQHELY